MANPAEARRKYLDRLSPEQQARVMRIAEQIGPTPTDVDWLVCEAAQNAADRVDIAAERIEIASGAGPSMQTQAMLTEIRGLLTTSADAVRTAYFVGDTIGRAQKTLTKTAYTLGFVLFLVFGAAIVGGFVIGYNQALVQPTTICHLVETQYKEAERNRNVTVGKFLRSFYAARGCTR